MDNGNGDFEKVRGWGVLVFGFFPFVVGDDSVRLVSSCSNVI